MSWDVPIAIADYNSMINKPTYFHYGNTGIQYITDTNI